MRAPVACGSHAPNPRRAGVARRLHFRALAYCQGWPTALARAQADADLEAWAWTRVGCYGKAAEFAAAAPRRLEGAMAQVSALAACGRADAAAAVGRAWLARSGADRAARRRLAEAAAPFAPGLALAFLGDGGAPEFRAALLWATDDRQAARQAAGAALAGRAAPAEAALIAANCGLLDSVDALNLCLSGDRLSAVAATGAPTPQRLAAAGPVAAQRGGPLVSVIVAAYETGDRLAAALRSLTAQSHAEIEIIVVDDGSRDATGDVATRLAQADPRIRVLRHARNRGPYAARMTALEIARGAFVTCHDSDDWAHPERIARQVAALVARPSLVATVSRWVRVSDEGRFFARQSWPLIRINPASPLFRRTAVLERIGGFDQVRAGADSEFLERMKLAFGASAVLRMPELLTVGAHRPGSLMTDAAIGVTDRIPSPSRLAYWEAWRTWHVSECAAGRTPRLPCSGPRPFYAPPELLPEASDAPPRPADVKTGRNQSVYSRRTLQRDD